jgi:hypothetical protein
MNIVPIIVAAFWLMLAPPLTPTYSSCFEAYLATLYQINVADAHGLITHDTARARRLAAAAAYSDCKREAFRAWLRERIRTNPERIYD